MQDNGGVAGLKKADGSPGAEWGATMIDTIVAIGILAVVITGFFAVMASNIKLDAANRETALATASANQVLERMEGVPISEVYALFNESTADDPPGGEQVPGHLFEVAGLSTAGGENMATGEIVFPTSPLDGLLREDSQIPVLGLPMDLNADGTIDGKDHAGDYALLPVLIRLSWQGATGPRTFEVHTILGE